MISRRDFLVITSGVAAGAVIPYSAWSGRVGAAPLPGGSASLDPTTIPKYTTALPRPSAMPKTRVLADGIDYYEIAVRQLQQQILPTGMPTTKVWGYGSLVDQQFRAISKTVEATSGVPVRVKWINQLTDASGGYLPHLLPVDPSIHWANPGGVIDSRPSFSSKPDLYRGPVPMVSHVHGAHTGPESDGFAEAWWLPQANNLAGYTAKGSKYDQYDRSNTTPGTAVFQYPNTQRASAIWYHDHTLGMTRLNVYAGPAGFWMIRGGADDLPSGVLPAGPYEVPVVVQDRCFNADGSLWYPDTRHFFDGFGEDFPYIEHGIPPYWQPEFFANTMVVNGVSWPRLDAEPRRYRLRLLNGCGSRFLRLKLVAEDPGALAPAAQAGSQPSVLPLHVIGTDGGFLPAVSVQDDILMGPAERFDVVIDFTGCAGQTFYLVNEGPDEPFGGGEGGLDFDFADALTTRQIMQIVVGDYIGPDTSVPPSQLTLPSRTALPAPTSSRRVSLNEEALTLTDVDGTVVFDGPIAARLGIVGADDMGMGMMWADAPTETPLLGATEDWEICNFTMDAHPIHLHLVEFEVLGRAPMDSVPDATGALICQLPSNGPTFSSPNDWETGVKDTVIAYPGEITKIRARFDLPGLYQWHCHITEHEDNEMMRPMAVVSNTAVPLGRLDESVLVAVGAGSIDIAASRIDGLMSTGPGRAPRCSGATVLDALRVHTGITPVRSRGTVVRQGVTSADQRSLAADATSASAAARSLPGTRLTAINGSRTIAGTGLTVVNVPSISLSGNTRVLTLQGDPGTQFVVNVAGGISLANRASIRLVGVLPSQVLFNMTGTNRDLSLSGAAQASGMFLNVSGAVNIAGAAVTGSIVSGRAIQLAAAVLRRV